MNLFAQLSSRSISVYVHSWVIVAHRCDRSIPPSNSVPSAHDQRRSTCGQVLAGSAAAATYRQKERVRCLPSRPWFHRALPTAPGMCTRQAPAMIDVSQCKLVICIHHRPTDWTDKEKRRKKRRRRRRRWTCESNPRLASMRPSCRPVKSTTQHPPSPLNFGSEGPSHK